MSPRTPISAPGTGDASHKEGPALDLRQIRRAFGRAASSFDEADFLQTAVRDRLLERLELVQLSPDWIVDLGAGTGRATAALTDRFPGASLIAVDLVPAMLDAAQARTSARPGEAICADAAKLPFPDGSIDLIFSNLMLHWCPSLDAIFAEVRRVLRHPGLFTFATLGPDSFRELRHAWGTVDNAPHVMTFPEMRALGDGLVRAGLSEPVVDVEILTINYRDLGQLTADLRATGTTNPHAARRRGLTGRQAWARMQSAYETRKTPDGKLPATLEIIYGQAWAPGPLARRSRPDGDTVFPLADLRRRPGVGPGKT